MTKAKGPPFWIVERECPSCGEVVSVRVYNVKTGREASARLRGSLLKFCRSCVVQATELRLNTLLDRIEELESRLPKQGSSATAA